MNYVMYLTVKNNAESYAKCTQYIEKIYHRNFDENEAKSIVKNRHNIGKYNNKTMPSAKFEEPLKGYDISSSVERINIYENGFDFCNCLKNIHFHIRVDFSEESSMENLHYLALLIYKLRDLVNKKRLSIFLVPRTGNKYPFENENGEVDTELYNEVSKHLRPIIEKANQGIIYGVNHKKEDVNDTIVSSLDFKITGKTEKAFPLILVNGNIKSKKEEILEYINAPKTASQKKKTEEYSKKTIDNYKLLFTKGVACKYFDTALSLKKNERFGFANHTCPDIALCDYLFEVSYLSLKSKFEEINFNLKEMKNIIKGEFYNSSVLQFSIFSFILDLSMCEKHDLLLIKQKVFSCYKLSQDISEALNQIIQNSIQHSEQKICVVTLTLEKEQLKMIVSDLGSKTIPETFSQNLKNEIAFIGSPKNNKISSELGTKPYMKNFKYDLGVFNDYFNKFGYKLPICCFFNDFTDMKNESNFKIWWYNFRQNDSSAHIGLTLFSNTVKKYGGNFSVFSSTDYKISENITRFNLYRSKDDDRNDDPEYRFPGTEFIIGLPIRVLNQTGNNTFTQLHNLGYIESYDSYAKFIDYDSKNLDFDLKEDFINNTKGYNLNIALDKFEMQIYWTNFWLSVLDKINVKISNKLYYIDYRKLNTANEYFTENNISEIIIKGFINALGIFADVHSSKEIYLALVNVNDDFFNMFKKVTFSLSIKVFPSNVQLFVSDESELSQAHLLGQNYGYAIKNAYIISIENGMKSYDGNVYYKVNDLFKPFAEQLRVCEKGKTKFLFPFTAILDSNTSPNKMFFKKTSDIANEKVIEGKGFKFENAHTRLGNKVHIDEFYELSYLFYRTILANNVAFYIIRSLKGVNSIDILEDKIIFYGYSSYSQAILMSLTKILEIYRLNNGKPQELIPYAIYQYNLQYESTSGDIRIYLSDETKKKNETVSEIKTKVIQIVPISSTLTTFAKMWSKFSHDKNKDKLYSLNENYTVFWVRDKNLDNQSEDESEITEIEKKYFYAPKEHTVKTKFRTLNGKDEVKFILTGKAKWHIPEKCDLCYPPEDLLQEMPLIETDQTSTVPAQQTYLTNKEQRKLKPLTFEEQRTFASLLGHVHYGHFKRGKNHYQYFVDTQGYFATVSNDVKNWLTYLSKKERDNESEYPYINIIFSPEHNTNVGFSQYVNTYFYNGTAEIVSINEDKEFRTNFKCEHNELAKTIKKLFDDYINAHYELQSGSRKLQSDYRPVRFIFVDDNLITGETFRKASSLLQSLLPEGLLKNYGTNVFSQSFVLIDRLSDSSKNSYILPKESYYSYCHIDISNMRKQGDSCVGCKLRKNADRLYKRSATQNASNYWGKKRNDLKAIPFEEVHKRNNYEKSQSYLRMALSHTVKKYFNLESNDENTVFNQILSLFDFFSDNNKMVLDIGNDEIEFLKSYWNIITLKYNEEKDKERITDNVLPEYLNEYHSIKNTSIIDCLIKITTRPFFTFNHNFKTQILKFIIILCETVFNSFGDNISEGNNSSGFKVAEKIVAMYKSNTDKLIFLQKVLFEALADLQSTYLIRKKTLTSVLRFLNNFREDELQCSCSTSTPKKCCLFVPKDNDEEKCALKKIECFFLFYSICVQRIVDSSSDETRSLWLEHFFVTGEEKYSEIKESSETLTSPYEVKPFWKNIIDNSGISTTNKDLIKYFQMFCNEIFFSNGRILYDGIERMASEKEIDENIAENYFMDRWKSVRKIDNWWLKSTSNNCKEMQTADAKTCFIEQEKITDEINLYNWLSSEEEIADVGGRELISKRYKILLNDIKKMIISKYHMDTKLIDLVLLTGTPQDENVVSIRDLEMIEYADEEFFAEQTNEKMHKLESNEKYDIKIKIKEALDVQDDNGLKKRGYYLKLENSNAFDNNIKNSSIENSYCILRFDNPYRKSECSDTKKIVPVYLYISLKVKGEKENDNLSKLIIRDILTFRNGIVKYLEKDFTSDVMKKYALSIDTEAILKNEKIMSHTPMLQDKNEIDILLNESRNPENEITKNRIKDWVLARNYCNTIIARLYNRTFRNINKNFNEIITESKLNKNREVYKLYVNYESNDGMNEPLKTIKQILPLHSDDCASEDFIYKLMSEIIDFDTGNIDSMQFEAVTKKEGDEKYSYNLEFIKNIIYRICFDAMRFSYGAGAECNDFIQRIKNHYATLKKKTDKVGNDKELFSRLQKKSEKYDICKIKFEVERCSESKTFDWLVLKNEVFQYDDCDIDLINKKLEDPLDFTDGHMSLITAKEYLSKLVDDDASVLLSKMYSYVENEDGKKFFVTRLPIISKKGDYNEKQRIDMDR